MKLKILELKMLQRMVRKFPDKQYNPQNSVLFHKTIPLSNNLKAKPFSAGKSVHFSKILNEACQHFPIIGILYSCHFP
jgi:hypothetical protein